MIAPEIIYVGGFRFPDGDAGAARVRGIGLALSDAGYEVAFAGIEDQASPDDLLPDGTACRDGLPYYPAKNLGASKFAKLRRFFYHYITGSATMDRLNALDSARTRAIIVYNGTAPLLLRLLKFCSRRKISLIADCTEWFDPRHVLGGRYGWFQWDSELRMRWLQPKLDGMIAISSFLERYYQQRGMNVLRLPPMVDLQSTLWKSAQTAPQDNAELRLVYAGSPGKKDILINALRAAIVLRNENYPIKIHLVGLNRDKCRSWLRDDPALVEKLEDIVVCHGRVSQARAIELVSTADFSILLREDKRYAHAGFPTKLVESLSAGVPIITNATSDIAEYVRDEQEGILLENHSPEAFAEGIRRVFRMPRSKWHEMRFHARRQAEEFFDYRRYVSPLRDCIEQIYSQKLECSRSKSK
jgi:glycosyltransferase involved in cell wall biosynthesis